MRKKPGDHQVLGNVIEAHQSLRFLGHLSWFDRRVLAAKMKIRLSIFAHKLQFSAYGLHSFRRIQGTCIPNPKYYHYLFEALSDSSERC